jgi:hypothetical protein
MEITKHLETIKIKTQKNKSIITMKISSSNLKF